MREGWRSVRMSDIAVESKSRVRLEEGAEYPTVGVMMYGQGLLDREPFIGGQTTYTKLTPLETGQLVLRSITAFEAPIAVVEPRHDGFHVSGVFPVFDLSTSDILPRYMSLVCTNPTFWQAMRERTTGSVLRRMTLSAKGLLDIPLALPPLAEQRRIVDVIESVDTYISALEKRAETARTARSALLHELLSNPGPDWVETTFGKICSIDAQLVDPKKPEYRDLPHLAIEKIESRTGRIFPLASASDDGVISSKFLFNKNEVVYSKIRPELRKACRPGFAGLASADAYPLRPVNGCTAEFLLALILSEEFSQMAVERSARTKMPKLNRVDLFSIPVQLPPLSDQLRIAELLVDFENLETGVSAILNRSRRLRNALLSDLLSGAHEVPASYDELLGAA